MTSVHTQLDAMCQLYNEQDHDTADEKHQCAACQVKHNEYPGVLFALNEIVRHQENILRDSENASEYGCAVEGRQQQVFMPLLLVQELVGIDGAAVDDG